MRTLIIILLVAVAVNALTFEEWAVKNNKVYGSKLEKAKRNAIYNANLKTVAKLNAESDGAVFGMTKFADLTPAEFKAQYLNYRVSDDPFCPLGPNATNPGPATFDWRDKKAVLPVKDQGSCGSCWAFSTVGNMEGMWFLAGNPLTSLSEQQLVDCDHTCDPNDPNTCNEGCNGGWMNFAMHYAIENGMESEDDYGYDGYDEDCRYDESLVVAKFSSCRTFPNDLKEVANSLAAIGPLSIGVHADPWQFYSSGIFSSSCGNTPADLDHGVTLVGYGTASSKNYWIIKNSWGSGWGESGYIRVLKDTKNLCGVTTEVASIIV